MKKAILLSAILLTAITLVGQDSVFEKFGESAFLNYPGANAFSPSKAVNGLDTPEPYKATRISGEIIFDGIPDEAVWQSIEALPMVTIVPAFGKEPGETSVIKIAYDDEYFYVSGILNYNDIRNLRAVGKKRDYGDRSSSWFGFILDTFNDRENAVAFMTNPNGIRSDGSIKNDCEDEDRDFNGSWNTFWDVKTAITDEGWTAEIRVPFSSLRFQVQDGRTLMGLLIVRWSPAISELSTFPQASPRLSSPYYRPSLSRVIEFEGLQATNPLYITPYVIGGLSQIYELNEAGSAYIMKTDYKYAAGGDVKYSITNNLTLDLTINTDFAQVEADDQKINLTRYSLYFPEKRVFFQEKSDVFDFSFLEGNNLFYSRRIGLYQGNAVRIFGGVRLTGRIGEWDVGFLDMQTEKFEENPSENFGVLRLKRSVLNQNSYLGGMITSRLGMDGSYNLAYGLDGLFRLTGDEYLNLKIAQTFQDESDNNPFELSPTRLLLQWQRRSLVGLGYDFAYTYAGNTYYPGIGFERNLNFHGPVGKILYGWLPEGNTFLRYYRLALSGYNYWNTQSGQQETTNTTTTFYWEARKGFGGNVSAYWFSENLAEKLILGNGQAEVPPGDYSFLYFSSGYSTSRAKNLSGSISATAGWFYDGWRLSFYANPKLKVGTDFDLGLSYYLDYVDFPERDMRFTNHILGFTGLMTLTTTTSLATFIQYNTAIKRVIGNVRFRYNPREGNDFYIVYDEGLNTDIHRLTPSLPFSIGRTILLKYTYTFKL
jgi:hypothetical protein